MRANNEGVERTSAPGLPTLLVVKSSVTVVSVTAICPGLMAIGEAACVSVHGANRLGTNSLLDIVVFGRAAALRAAEILEPGAKTKPANDEATDRAIARLDRLRHADGDISTAEIRLKMQRIMPVSYTHLTLPTNREV